MSANNVNLCAACEEDIHRLGFSIGEHIFAGAFIALFGDMGAGKTTLTRAIGEALGAKGVASPTFTIVREHGGRIPLFHFDAYRLDDSFALYDIGFSDYMERNGVIVMEWCENVLDVLPDERLDIHLSGSGDEPRKVTLMPHGIKYERLVSEAIQC